MSDWVEVIEDGVVLYVNEEYGQVMKLTDGAYIAMAPKVVKLGPFETAEAAQQAIVKNSALINEMLDTFNHQLVDLAAEVKAGK